MTKILFATYTIKLRLKKKKEYFKINDVDGEDFYKIFVKFIESIEKEPVTLTTSFSASGVSGSKKP